MLGFTPQLSMREKSYYKRRINREHNSNLRAGYVHINEEQLHKTGLRGRKKYLFFGVVSFLLLLTIVNVGLTGVLLYVLRMNSEGMQSLKFISPGKEVHFRESAELGQVFLVQNEVQDISRGLGIYAVDSGVTLSSHGSGPTLHVDSDGLEILNVEKFQVVDPVGGRSIFDTESFKLPANLKSIGASGVQVEEINSPRGKDLTVLTEGDLGITGSKDVIVEGKRIEVAADESVQVDVDRLSLSSPGGVYLDDIDHMTKALPEPLSGVSAESYQLCVCLPSGLVFKVPVGVTCDAPNEPGKPHLCDI